MPNPYIPILTKVKSMVSENEVNDIKTFELEFVNEEEYKAFDYVPGQFAELLGIDHSVVREITNWR